METSKVVAVVDIENPSAAFRDDGDSDSLQIVFLSKNSGCPSRVSPGGEVIFLYKTDDDLQTKLIRRN